MCGIEKKWKKRQVGRRKQKRKERMVPVPFPACLSLFGWFDSGREDLCLSLSFSSHLFFFLSHNDDCLFSAFRLFILAAGYAQDLFIYVAFWRKWWRTVDERTQPVECQVNSNLIHSKVLFVCSTKIHCCTTYVGLYGWCNFQQQTSPVLHDPDYLMAIRLTGIKDGLDRIYLLIPDDSNMSLYLGAIHCVSLSLYVQPQRSNPPKCHPFPRSCGILSRMHLVDKKLARSRLEIDNFSFLVCLFIYWWMGHRDGMKYSRCAEVEGIAP